LGEAVMSKPVVELVICALVPVDPIGIRLGCARAAFGTVTVSSPFSTLASILSESISPERPS
jgi:hypothetical protein